MDVASFAGLVTPPVAGLGIPGSTDSFVDAVDANEAREDQQSPIVVRRPLPSYLQHSHCPLCPLARAVALGNLQVLAKFRHQPQGSQARLQLKEGNALVLCETLPWGRQWNQEKREKVLQVILASFRSFREERNFTVFYGSLEEEALEGLHSLGRVVKNFWKYTEYHTHILALNEYLKQGSEVSTPVAPASPPSPVACSSPVVVQPVAPQLFTPPMNIERLPSDLRAHILSRYNLSPPSVDTTAPPVDTASLRGHNPRGMLARRPSSYQGAVSSSPWGGLERLARGSLFHPADDGADDGAVDSDLD